MLFSSRLGDLANTELIAVPSTAAAHLARHARTIVLAESSASTGCRQTCHRTAQAFSPGDDAPLYAYWKQQQDGG